MKHFLYKGILAVLFLGLFAQGDACTTAVISGKYTKDGRPILWKLRDTDFLENKLKYYEEGTVSFIGLINSEDKEGEQVWGGTNSLGFSIINSASFNVNMDDTSGVHDLEGILMKRALVLCKDLNDFEKFLDTLKRPMGQASHFGVIDANGGAAFYEVNNYSYTKFDANDPSFAPNGYIIRTNFSFNGKKDTGYGFIRFQNAVELFNEADATGNISYQTVIQNFSRSLKHSLLNTDYRKSHESNKPNADFVVAEDLITRHSSSSALIFHGVKENDLAGMTTMWSVIGYPHTCVAIPVWVDGGKHMPLVLTAANGDNSPLNELSLKLKDRVYPIKRGSGYKYMKPKILITPQGDGCIQKIERFEKEIFFETEKKLEVWRNNSTNPKEIEEYYIWLSTKVLSFYDKNFGLIVE